MKTNLPIPRRWLGVPVVVAGALALGACANNIPRPTSTLSQAELAIAEASESNAPEYAPLALRKARDKLERARQAAEVEDNVTARRLAEQALVDAQVAQAQASAQTAQNAVTELRASIETLRQESVKTSGEAVKTRGDEQTQ